MCRDRLGHWCEHTGISSRRQLLSGSHTPGPALCSGLQSNAQGTNLKSQTAENRVVLGKKPLRLSLPALQLRSNLLSSQLKAEEYERSPGATSSLQLEAVCTGNPRQRPRSCSFSKAHPQRAHTAGPILPISHPRCLLLLSPSGQLWC